MKFDELHKFEVYFEPMAIGVDDKERRRELADLLTDAFLYFFAVYEVHDAHNGMLEKALYEQLLADRVSEAVSQVTGIDANISNHIRALAKEVVDVTFRNAKKDDEETEKRKKTDDDISDDLESEFEESPVPPLSPSGDSHIQEFEDIRFEDEAEYESLTDGEKEPGDYWLSYKRALSIAYNEANTFLNYTDYVEAKDLGRTKKTWLTMNDPKVRDTHEEIEGVTVGIDEKFIVGNSEMLFPHDWTSNPDPKEVINCRCAVEYK